MRFCMFCSAILAGLLSSNSPVHADEPSVGLMSIKPHPSVERTHACKIVKADDAVAGDCNEPKCFAGGSAVDVTLAAKGLKRVCKTIGASVNRGFDVTYVINGEKRVGWTARDPESDLRQIGLTPFEEYSPLNPACAQMTFKEASAISECVQIK